MVRYSICYFARGYTFRVSWIQSFSVTGWYGILFAHCIDESAGYRCIPKIYWKMGLGTTKTQLLLASDIKRGVSGSIFELLAKRYVGVVRL